MQHFTLTGSLGHASMTVKPCLVQPRFKAIRKDGFFSPVVQLLSDLQVPLPWGARQTSPMLATERPTSRASAEMCGVNMAGSLRPRP